MSSLHHLPMTRCDMETEKDRLRTVVDQIDPSIPLTCTYLDG